jgi:small subunit ribosomal protein S1
VTEPDDDFATMFEASLQARHVERGQPVEGRIVAVGEEVAFVDIGGKGEATIDLAELRNAEGQLEVAVGDQIQAIVVSTAGGLTLSRKLAGRGATDRQLEDAFQTGLPVEGKVEHEVKGGYEVRIGRLRAFCPFSQVGTSAGDPQAHEGQLYQFKIIEYSEGGRNLVVSRRALIEQEQQAREAEVRQSIVVGAVLNGRVASVREYGAFVDLGGGVQGLLHVSDMGWSRVPDPAQVVKPGDEITVKILRVDDDAGRISLGLKQLTADPWERVRDVYAVGQVRVGRVTRVAEFGAFVELEPGVEALAHESTFPPTGRSRGWSAAVTPGSTGAFEILSVDLARKRIGVALVLEGTERAAGAASQTEVVPGARLTGKVERHERFGVFVFLRPGRTGLIPMSETGLTSDADVRKAFPVGNDVDVVVLDVDATGRRIRLSAKAVQDAHEADEVREYQERHDRAPAEGFSSLADKLRGAIGRREK